MSTNTNEYMRQYMRDRSARLHAGNPRRIVQVAPQGSAERIAAERDLSIQEIAREHPAGGVCRICGHVTPDAACPVCVDELAHGAVTEAAWREVIAAIR